jgi:hypothetical protein
MVPSNKPPFSNTLHEMVLTSSRSFAGEVEAMPKGIALAQSPT